MSDLGCSIIELIRYLENKFDYGMTWENYGECEIDHKKPLSRFDLEHTEQHLEACNYKNLQPLWKTDNIKKGIDNIILSIFISISPFSSLFSFFRQWILLAVYRNL